MPTMTKAAKSAVRRPRAAKKKRARTKNDDLGTRLVEAAREALEFARGQTHGERIVVYRGSEREAVVTAAPAYASAQIAAIRGKLELSQSIFALILNVSVESVRAWEQGRRTPDGSALRLLQIADEAPEVLLVNMRAG